MTPSLELSADFVDDGKFWLVVACAIAMLVGLLGVIVPGLPGLALCFGAVLVWAIFGENGWGRWLIVGVCALWLAAGEIIKYAWPGKHLLNSGVPKMSVFVGAVAAIIGFFLIPVIGLPIGFVAGIWGMETYRLGGWRQAWPGTKNALKAIGLAVAVELFFGLLIAFTWILGLIFA